MATGAFSGVGTTFNRGNGETTETFTALAEVLSISGPSPTTDEIDVTNLDSAGGYREKITGFADPGQVQVSFNWTLATYGRLLVDLLARTARTYQIVLGNTERSIIQFEARVSGINQSITADKQVTCDATFLVDGAIDLTS
jgi:predicted secreted protein